MAGEVPAYLTVGTAVSAKYRGAFCEAKVKTVNKKLVKCKVYFKDQTSAIVHDEFIKGNLKIGATVEAKHPEHGTWLEGVISKLNDASVYTVLFDDGDEKTLRRTSLCLQGDRHFHESETLDHLPLTDPENFGTPVVRDRTKRKRSSSTNTQRVEEEEGESSGSEIFKRLRREEAENAIGRVVVVEMNEKRKLLSFPALIVDPSCTKDAPNRTKEHVVTRSFRDNKYYTVSEPSWRSFTSRDHVYKGDIPALKQAIEKAVLYIETGQLPQTWDYSILKSKEKTDGESEETGGSSDESDDDEYDEQKDAWLASLHKFMEERGTPINKPPVLGYRDLNLYKLYKLVQDLGGCKKVTDKQQWRYIASKMGIPIHTTHSYNIKTAYNKYLFAFEDHNRKLGSSFSSASVQGRPRRRSSYDRWTPFPPSAPPKEDKREPEKDRKKEGAPQEEEAEAKPEVTSPPEVKPIPKKKTRRKAESPETETVKEEEESKEPAITEQKPTPPRSGGKRAVAAGKPAPKEDAVEEKDDDEGLGPDFEIGEKVKVQYGRGRTHKVYEAKIVDVQGTDKNARYSVHYQGWNVRYDEVVTADRILSSVERRKEKRVARQKARREQRQRELEREQQRKREEEERIEQERKKEEERIEQERQKEAERIERERREAEEERIEQERREAEEAKKRALKVRRQVGTREKVRLKREKERLEQEEAEFVRCLQMEEEEMERVERAKPEGQGREPQEMQENQELEECEGKTEDEVQGSAAEKEPAAGEEASDDAKLKTPAKRGRPPSISPKTVSRPASPRVLGAGRKSPSASLYAIRSLRSDRASLTEPPIASGLEAGKARGRRSSAASRNKAEEEEDSGEESEVGTEQNKNSSQALVGPDDDEPKPLDPVPEEVPAEIAEGEAGMPNVDGLGQSQEGGNPPQSPPKLKKEGGLDEAEPTEETKELIGGTEEAKGKKGKRKGKKAAVEKESKQGKKASKRRHSKDARGGAKAESEVLEGKDDIEADGDMERAEDGETERNNEEGEGKEMDSETKKKGRKRGRKSLEEKSVGGKKAKKSLGDGVGDGGKKGRRRKRRHDEEEGNEDGQAKDETAPSTSQEDPVDGDLEVKMDAKPGEGEREPEGEKREVEAEPSTSDRMLTANITTPPTTPESSADGASSPNEDEGQEEEEGGHRGREEGVQANKSDSDSMGYMGSSGSSTSSVGKHERLEEVSSSNGGEATQPKRGRPLGSTKKKRKHSLMEGEGKAKAGKKSHKKKRDGRRRTTSPGSKPSSDTDDSFNAENKGEKAKVTDAGPSAEAKEPERTPRPCKYNFTIDVSHMSSPDDRIATIQKQLIDLREIYLSLKAEVSAIDRRRKRFKRKEREAQAAALMAATSLANFSNSAPAVSAAPVTSS